MSRIGLVLVLGVAACGGGGGSESLTITDPAGLVGMDHPVCASSDMDPALDGVQYTVTVAATGFADGDVVLLALDGAAPSTQLGQMVHGGTASFARFTLPAGHHSLVAFSSDLGVQSPAVAISVGADATVVTFAKPTDGATVTSADDVDAQTAGVQLDVVVDVSGADGQSVVLTVTDPSGQMTVLPGVLTSSGKATKRVSFPTDGVYHIQALSSSACPATASITIGINVAPPSNCMLTLTPAPTVHGGVGYLNAAADLDKSKAKLQATASVKSGVGYTVELSVLGGTATDLSMTVGSTGTVSFPLDLDDGALHVTARCRSPAGALSPTQEIPVTVDTVAPTCKITAPVDRATLSPLDDLDQNTAGTQFAVVAAIAGGDSEGETATLSVGGAQQMTQIKGGAATGVGALAAPQTGVAISVAAADHAGNTCTDAISVDYQTEGCTVQFTAPIEDVTHDADASTAGVQADVVVQVGAACADRAVTLFGCDVSPAALTVTAVGQTATFAGVTLCAADQCTRTARTCVAQATNGTLTSTATQTIVVDTNPPLISIIVVQPSVACGGSVTAADDFDQNPANGIQVQARVLGLVDVRWIETTPPGDGTKIPVDANGAAVITLTTGANTLVGKGMDASGLVGSSPPCPISASTLGVAITSPANGAVLGRADGTVDGSALDVQVCGTVGEAATATVQVSVDGGSPVAAVIDDVGTGHWCAAAIAIAEGAHAISAAATSTSGGSGTATAAVTVDLTASAAPTDLTLTVTKRNTVAVAWTAPGDAGGGAVAHCVVKSSEAAIPDTAAFDAIAAVGADVAGVAPGERQTAPIQPLKPGRPYFFGVRCYDRAANASDLLTSATGTTTAVTQSAALAPAAVPGYDLTNAEFGFAATGVDLNGDGFSDVVVGALQACTTAVGCGNLGEGLVYIYMGSATGVGTAPDFVIRGTDLTGSEGLGASLAAIDWNHDGVPDLVVGAPYAGEASGKVFIYFGDAGGGGAASRWQPSASTTYVDDTTADVTIFPDQTDTWLKGITTFGWRVGALDFDGDGRDDLVITAPATDGFNGGVVVVHGPPTDLLTGTIAIPGGLGTGAGKAGTTARGYTLTSFPTQGVEYGSSLGVLGKLGDAPSDARDDFVIAPVAADFKDKAANPTALVFFGEPQSATAWTTLAAKDAADQMIQSPVSSGADSFAFGVALGAIQDVTGDGRRDLVIADPIYGNGTVWIVPGGVAGTSSVTSAFTTLTGPAGLGAGLASPGRLGGDVDGDGVEDLLLSSTPAPVLSVWFGGAGADPTLGASYPAPSAFARSTLAVWVGDVNGDGLADAVWADDQQDASAQTGAIQVVY